MANNWMGVAPSPGNPQDTEKPLTYGGTKTPGGYTSSVSGSGFGKTLGGAVGGFGGAVAGAGLDLLGSYIGSEISGRVNEKYAKRAEERMDKRNRQMLLDQPSLTAEGRRRAGLNPYGDATLPGMTSQSSVDTSSNSSGAFSKSVEDFRRLSFDEQVALARLENERIVAESQAKLNDAKAEESKGTEQRASEGWTYSLNMLKNQSYSSDIERSFAYSNAYVDLMQKNQDLSNAGVEYWRINAEIQKLYADAEYSDAKANEVDRNIEHMEFSEQYQLLSLTCDFILKNAEFYHETELQVLAQRFDAWKQKDQQAHERFMLGKSQDFNASENDKQRTRQMWDNIIGTGAGALATIVGAILAGSGVGAAPGALLASLGLTKMANSVAGFSAPRPQIGYKK